MLVGFWYHMHMSAKVIIIRGPSGAGKSTIAKRLQAECKDPILIIEQDYYRHTVLGDRPDDKQLVPKLIYENARTMLDAGYTVIIEGIFRKEKYAPMFNRLVHEHPRKSFVYFLDIDFEETVKRHATREKSKNFGREEMQSWFHMAEPLGFENEIIIPSSSSISESVNVIRADISHPNQTSNTL
jgi:adenylate kinase family enzyme